MSVSERRILALAADAAALTMRGSESTSAPSAAKGDAPAPAKKDPVFVVAPCLQFPTGESITMM